MAAIPDSLISTVYPFSTPHLRELILISTSILNRGWRRASGIVRTGVLLQSSISQQQTPRAPVLVFSIAEIVPYYCGAGCSLSDTPGNYCEGNGQPHAETCRGLFHNCAILERHEIGDDCKLDELSET